MRGWALDSVVMPVVLLMFLRTAIPGEVPTCGLWWRKDQGTLSCGDETVSSAALGRFSELEVLLLDHVTLVKAPTARTILSEGLVSLRADDGRELTTVEYLGVQSMVVPEWLLQRLPNLRTLTLRAAFFDFSWLRYTPSLKRLSVAGMKVPSTLPLEDLPELEEVDLVVVPNDLEIEQEIRRRRPDIDVKVVRD